MTRDSPTRFKGSRVSPSAPLGAADFTRRRQAAGKARHASVNDVLLSCAAGALRSYLVDKGDPVRAW